MGLMLSVDFGTTNTVIASRASAQAEIQVAALPGLSSAQAGHPPVVPSLVYVQEGGAAGVALGQAVIDRGFTQHHSNRLFRNFKRGVVASPAPAPRLIDGVLWADRDAAEQFLRGVFDKLPFPKDEIEQLVVTAPVSAFESYLAWLEETLKGLAPERLRIVDEATAAALGYAVTEPGAKVLVFDFGGGTLDLALVQLPEESSKAGGFLQALLKGGGARQHAARVVAKAGRILGGSDVDQWLLAEVLRQAKLTTADLGDGYAALLTACEQAKIALSSAEAAPVAFTAGGQARAVPLTRADLERVLEERGFFNAVRHTVDQAMQVAHQRGILKEDVDAVLMVGGTSLMPPVQQAVRRYFGDRAVRVDKPFTAVVEGALQLAAGLGLQDYLMHGYGLRYFDPATGAHRYDEIIPMGSRYPFEKPVEVRLAAAHAGQADMEFVVGEMELDAVSMVEVRYESGQAVFVAQSTEAGQKILPLNEAEPMVIRLDPPGQPGQDCLQARFTVDERRQLRLTVEDVRSGREVARETVVTALADRGAPPTQTVAGAKTLFDGRNVATVDSEEALREIMSDKAWLTELQAHTGLAGPATAAQAAPLTGREPRLSAGEGKLGKQKLSLRGLATMLVNLPPEAISIEAAAAALRSSDYYVRYSAAESLGRRGDREARLALQDALTQGPATTRASVAHHLHRLSWFAAEPLLRQAFQDSDLRVHECAVYGLCNLGNANAYALLRELLPREPDNVRLAAAWGLNHRRDPGAIPVLAIALQAQDPEVRVKALESLGETELPEAAPAIRSALRDPDPEVKYAATLSLLEVSGEACLSELANLIEQTAGQNRRSYLRGLFHATNYLLVNVGATAAAGQVLDAIEKALQDDLPETRMAAAAPLAWMRHPRAAAMLQRAYAQEPDGEAQAYIVTMAFCLASEAAGAILKNAVQSQDELVRRTAELYYDPTH